MRFENIIIISEDICAIKQIVNILSRISPMFSVMIYSPVDFQNNLERIVCQDVKQIYFIDTYGMEIHFLEVIDEIKKRDSNSKIVILTVDSTLKPLIVSHSKIEWLLEKNQYFHQHLVEVLLEIVQKEDNKFKISDSLFPITLNRNDIEEIYHFPNQQVSINYKNGNNHLLISLSHTSESLRELVNNRFYMDKTELRNSKKTYYSEPFKQLIVDLYTNFKIDSNVLAKHFRVNSNYIKKWASLAKYNRKLNKIEWFVGKLIIRSYFKK